MLFHSPCVGGKIRHCAPERNIHKQALINCLQVSCWSIRIPDNFFKFANICIHSLSLKFIRFMSAKIINFTLLAKRQQNLEKSSNFWKFLLNSLFFLKSFDCRPHCISSFLTINRISLKKSLWITWVFPLKPRITRKCLDKWPSKERSEDFLFILQNRVRATKRRLNGFLN